MIFNIDNLTANEL